MRSLSAPKLAPVGHFVYLLFCRTAASDHVDVKVGLSDEPLKRLLALISASPVPAELFAVCECSSRAVSTNFERALLAAFQQWNTHGEWLRVPNAERTSFRQILQLTTKLQPGLPRRIWTQVQVQEYASQRRQARDHVQSRYRRFAMKAGRAFRDFEKASRQ
jgi:hypothetical protein